MASISNVTFDFLKDLKNNNNREWFAEYKDRYQASHDEMLTLSSNLLSKVGEFDQLEKVGPKKVLYRIYRDVRFSKNKDPYKTNRSGYFARLGAQRRGSYYFSISPRASMIGGGFYQPNTEDLNHIRQQIDLDSSPLRNAIENKDFKKYFGEMQGEQLKSKPRGFEIDHPDIDLLRYKSFYFMKEFSDKEVMLADFEQKASEGFQKLKPFLEAMTEYLTTDLNGSPIV